MSRHSYSTELVHLVCDRIRFFGENKECCKCPPSVNIPNHGDGVAGCYLAAEETIKLILSRLAGPGDGELVPTKAAIVRSHQLLRDALAELLRLFDWRNEIGRIERDFNHDRKQVKTWLNQYGREKKQAWFVARELLTGGRKTYDFNAAPQVSTASPVLARDGQQGPLPAVAAPCRDTELRVLKEISDELSLHGHGLAAARVERRIMLLAATPNHIEEERP